MTIPEGRARTRLSGEVLSGTAGRARAEPPSVDLSTVLPAPSLPAEARDGVLPFSTWVCRHVGQAMHSWCVGTAAGASVPRGPLTILLHSAVSLRARDESPTARCASWAPVVHVGYKNLLTRPRRGKLEAFPCQSTIQSPRSPATSLPELMISREVLTPAKRGIGQPDAQGRPRHDQDRQGHVEGDYEADPEPPGVGREVRLGVHQARGGSRARG